MITKVSKPTFADGMVLFGNGLFLYRKAEEAVESPILSVVLGYANQL
ncbi:hypothetical protein [Pedobacter xixiisoli]|uniref:Uncharacterized protein n=1 Tax=Pedobacter xixiisoli TaxID=1476464 RepID=A0A285ZQ29_9SPHI|nr:hypothetical protein [Pedobacter xixiisoli]SOD11771.1 hypothetical protein SAMN06297358_0324 [Pedobacter xixiisoli]